MLQERNGIIIDGKLFKSTYDKRLALIGSRNASQQELEQSYKLGYLMVKRGNVVVSGLAEGIDKAGMLGAIKAIQEGYSGGVIGIAPCFYGEIYPRKHTDLFNLTKECGFIIYPYYKDVLTKEEYQKRRYGKQYYEYDIKPLLTDRSVLNGDICSQVHIVKDSNIITGGSRYAPYKGFQNGIQSYLWNSKGERTQAFKFDRNPQLLQPLYSKQTILELIE